MYCRCTPIIPIPVSESFAELSEGVFSITGVLPFTRNSIFRTLKLTKPQVFSPLSCVDVLIYPLCLMDGTGWEDYDSSQIFLSVFSVHSQFSAV